MKLVRFVLLAVSAASDVVGAIVTLPLATRLVGELTDAVSAVGTEVLGMLGEVEDAVPGFV